MRATVLTVFLLSPQVAPLAAQAAISSPALRAAIETITADDIAHRIGVIADDSMQGRATPSPGLERTANYIAREFARFGLRPAGDGGWLQRYTIARRRIEPASSSVVFRFAGQEIRAALNRDARFALGSVPGGDLAVPSVVLGGSFGPADVPALGARGKAVILVMDYTQPIPPSLFPSLGALQENGAAGVILLSNRDSTTFAQRVASQAQIRVTVAGADESGFPVVEVHERAVAGLLAAAGVRPADFRAGGGVVTRNLPALTIGFSLHDEILDSASAPNVVGVLEGSDPKLRREYVVFSAHMDHLGVAGDGGSCRPREADSICNGADDDGSGTAGVIELAEAFSRKGARPKRSLIFLTVSGEERGLWGSSYFVDHPPVPLAQVVADFNMDMIGRNWRDTIVAIGKEHSDLGGTLETVVAAHPELGMVAIDDRWPEENFYFRSDHFNFARKGVPILFFFNGVHPDYHQVSDSPDRIDSEKESRIVRLLFLLGQTVANAPERPRWKPESYRKIVEQNGGR